MACSLTVWVRTRPTTTWCRRRTQVGKESTMIWSWHSTTPGSLVNTGWSSFAAPAMRSKATALACVVLCCGILHGCLILPIPVPRSSGPVAGSRAEVSKTLPEQVKAGETTRTDVLLLLGEPDGRGDLDRWFTYGSRVGRGGVGWELLWMVGPGYGGTGGTIKLDDWEKVRRATIQFNAAGVVSQVVFEEYHCPIGKGGCPDIRH